MMNLGNVRTGLVLAAILTTDAAQLAAIASAAASAAPAKAQPAGAGGDLEKGLTAIALKAAPGMKPEGALASGTLKEGDHLGWSVTMFPPTMATGLTAKTACGTAEDFGSPTPAGEYAAGTVRVSGWNVGPVMSDE